MRGVRDRRRPAAGWKAASRACALSLAPSRCLRPFPPYSLVRYTPITAHHCLPNATPSLRSDGRIHLLAPQFPFPVRFTYLDTSGRPVLVLRRANVAVPELAAKFSVEYSFGAVHTLREPLLLVRVGAGVCVGVHRCASLFRGQSGHPHRGEGAAVLLVGGGRRRAGMISAFSARVQRKPGEYCMALAMGGGGAYTSHTGLAARTACQVFVRGPASPCASICPPAARGLLRRANPVAFMFQRAQRHCPIRMSNPCGAPPYPQIGVFFCLFLAVIAYNRMEFTITRDDKWAAARDREALATTMEQIAALLEGERGCVRATGERVQGEARWFQWLGAKGSRLVMEQIQRC